MLIEQKMLHVQKGAVFIEAALALPVVLMFLFMTCSMSILTLKRNYIQEEMQQTVRAVTLSGPGYCSDLAESLLREKLIQDGHSDASIMVTTTPVAGNRIDMEFRIALNAPTYILSVVNQNEITKKYRVKIESPDGCSAL